MTDSPTARVVEVIADIGESAHPRYRYGSGCIVAGSTVLTAAHVVAGAASIEVRDPNKVPYAASCDQQLIGDEHGPGPDLAIVDIAERADSAEDRPLSELGPIPLAKVNRESKEGAVVDRCQAIGYPSFAELPGPSDIRETVGAFGFIPVASGLVRGLLSLQVIGPPHPILPGSGALRESEWSGMSGAPVFAGGYLVGVVTEHAPRAGPSTLTATPLTAVAEDQEHRDWGPGVSNAKAWWAKLRTDGPEEMQELPPQRELPAYRATIREIQRRTMELRGRKRELEGIALFAQSNEGFRWIVGDVYAGKTALLASAIAALPERTDVVAYSSRAERRTPIAASFLRRSFRSLHTFSRSMCR